MFAEHHHDDRRETISIAPTWAGIMPALLLLLESGGEEGKEAAKIELLRCAKIADAYATTKEGRSK